MPRTGTRRRLSHPAIFATGLLIAGNLALPAHAAPEPSAKLVHCGDESCLRISGHREDPAAIVRINGHTLPAHGTRRWKIDLPVETVRQWSAPHARTVEVSLHDPATGREASASVELPIGLLGGATRLASLVVTAS